jgi:hypothetical protein
MLSSKEQLDQTMYLAPGSGPAGLGKPSAIGSAIGFPKHPDQHRPKRPVLLAVDQEFGEGATLRVAPELSDPVGPLEVGERQDVEQLSA